MKNASKTLLTVGAILSIFAFIVFLVLSILFFFAASPEAAESLKEGINNGTITINGTGTIDDKIQAAQALSTSLAALFIILALFSIPAIIIAFISKNKSNKVLFILDILFGSFANTLIFIGGILGLIAAIRNNKASE